MKRNTIIKIFLDVVMLILYLLLMYARGLGGFFHEAVGIGIGILFIIHVVMNYSMTKGLLKSVLNGKAKITKNILFISDILLTICMPFVILTGVLIAKELFIIDLGLPGFLLFNVHNILSYVCLGTMILHILMHYKYLLGIIKKLPYSITSKEMKSALARFSCGAAVALILYSSLAVFKNSTTKPITSNENNTNDDKNTVSSYEFNNSNSYTESIVSIDNTESTISIDESSTITESQNEDSVIESVEPTTPPVPTLEEYLSKLRCTGCERHCSLLTPSCRKGEFQAQQAEQDYYEQYDISYN